VHHLSQNYISLITALFDLNQHMDPAEDKQYAVEDMFRTIGEGLPSVLNEDEAASVASLLHAGLRRYEELTGGKLWTDGPPVDTVMNVLQDLKNYD
jgi:hypothetical protein